MALKSGLSLGIYAAVGVCFGQLKRLRGMPMMRANSSATRSWRCHGLPWIDLPGMLSMVFWMALGLCSRVRSVAAAGLRTEFPLQLCKVI